MRFIRFTVFVFFAICLLGLLYRLAYHTGSLSAVHLIALDKESVVVLVDEDATRKHIWKVDSPRAYLLPNGDLFALHGTHSKREKKLYKNSLNVIARYSWSGQRLWSYRHSEKLHHDFALADDGIYLLSHKYVDGFFRDRHVKDVPPHYQLREDVIVNIDLQGKVRWEWSIDPKLFDAVHCKFRDCAKNIKSKSRTLDWTHFNSIKIIPPNSHFEQGQLAFRPGNLLVLARNWHQMFVLDIESKQIVWEYPEEGDPLMNGGHEASMIPPGYPGEGNIIFFENGWDDPGKGQSRIREFHPVTRKTVWSYGPDGFYSEYQGSVQRLKNGNTFISSDYQKICFVVSPAGVLQWAYKTSDHMYRCRRYEDGYLFR